jgi:hypothetical protein
MRSKTRVQSEANVPTLYYFAFVVLARSPTNTVAPMFVSWRSAERFTSSAV